MVPHFKTKMKLISKRSTVLAVTLLSSDLDDSRERAAHRLAENGEQQEMGLQDWRQHELQRVAPENNEQRERHASQRCTLSSPCQNDRIKFEVECLEWEGYCDEDHTWEPENNLNWPELIRAFEKTRKKKGAERKGAESDKDAMKRKCTATPDLKDPKRSISDAIKPLGFDRGLEPEKIIGATDSSGELMFLMKWQGTDEAEFVQAKQAKVRCPQVVIQFYEERLVLQSLTPSSDGAGDED